MDLGHAAIDQLLRVVGLPELQLGDVGAELVGSRAGLVADPVARLLQSDLVGKAGDLAATPLDKVADLLDPLLDLVLDDIRYEVLGLKPGSCRSTCRIDAARFLDARRACTVHGSIRRRSRSRTRRSPRTAVRSSRAQLTTASLIVPKATTARIARTPPGHGLDAQVDARSQTTGSRRTYS
nr:hypothetical protein [Streptomyces katrae]